MSSKTIELNRAQVSLTPPGGTRVTVLGTQQSPTDISAPLNKQHLYTVYYEMYRRHPWVRAAVDKRAQLSVSAGYHLTPEDPQETLDAAKAKEFRAFARRSNFAQLRRSSYKDIEIFSESFWYVQTTKGGKPYKAFRLHPKYTHPVTENGVVVKYAYGSVGAPDRVYYPEKQVLHFRDEDPDQDIQGLSKMFSLMETVSQDLWAMRYNLAFFENSAQTGIVFNMRNASKEEADRNRVWLEQNYSGAERAHRPIVLEGDIEIKSSVAKHHEMEFVQGRTVNRQEILAVLDVNESILGINGDSNRSNAKENDLSLRDSIAARQMLIEEEVNNKLIAGLFGWDDLLFEEDDSSKRNQLEQTSLWTQLLTNGLMNRDEIRARLGLGEIEGGDVFTIQTATGTVPVSEIMNAFQQGQQLAAQLKQDPPPAPDAGQDADGNDAQKREDRRREVDARKR